MKKFIFRISDGIQVMIESETLAGAKKEYEIIKQEAGETSIEIPVEEKKVSNSSQRKGLYEHLLELKDEGFFANPETLGDIKIKLQEKTLHYPTTTFPPYLNRLIREKTLRRFKQNKDGKEAWVYVNH
jgi:hypothetical protein